MGAKEKRLSHASNCVKSIIMWFTNFNKADAQALLAAFEIFIINGIQGGCLSEPVTLSADTDWLTLNVVSLALLLGPLVWAVRVAAVACLYEHRHGPLLGHPWPCLWKCQHSATWSPPANWAYTYVLGWSSALVQSSLTGQWGHAWSIFIFQPGFVETGTRSWWL